MASANTFPHVIEASDLADLASIHVAELQFGAICWVDSENASFTLTQTPNSPPDGVTVVSPVAGAAVGKAGAAWQKGGGGGGGTELLEGVTLAQLATIHGNDASSLAYVFDTRTFYRWFPADVTTPNGYTVVAAPGGNWHLEGDNVYLTPLGGGADDWPRLVGFANALAYKGSVTLIASAADFLCKSVVQLVSGVTVRGEGPGTRIVSSLTPTGGPGGFAQSVFYADKTNGAATTLSSNAVIGTNTVQVTANVAPAGSIIVITRTPLVGQGFGVLAVAGVGPFTLTLDDSVEFSFQAGDVVTVVNRTSDITIEGNGMVITGTGDRAVELVCTQRARVQDVRVSRDGGSFTSIVCSFDVAGRDNLFLRLNVDGGGVSAACVAQESGVRERIEGCRVAFTAAGSTNVGIIALSSARGFILNCVAENCGTGLFLAYSDAQDVDACRIMQVANVQIENCGSNGVLQAGGSGNQYTNIASSSNVGAGVAFDVSSAGQAPSASMANVTCDSNASAFGGFWVPAAGARVTVAGLSASLNTNSGIHVSGAGAVVTVTGLQATDNGTGPWLTTGGVRLDIADALVRKTTNASVIQGLLQGTGDYVALSDYTAQLVGVVTGVTALADVQAAGTFVHRGCALAVTSTTHFGYGVYAAHGVTNKIIDGGSNDLSDATIAAYQFDGSTRANFGQFAANGATPVVVNGIFLANAAIVISFNTLGGAQGAQPVISTKAANSFSAKATAGDTSTYDWKAP